MGWAPRLVSLRSAVLKILLWRSKLPVNALVCKGLPVFGLRVKDRLL